MEKLTNKTIFKCEYCTKVSLSAAAMYSHEQRCRANPHNQYKCASCKNCKKIVSYSEKWAKCNHCWYLKEDRSCEHENTCEGRIEYVDFVCKTDNARMYAPKKIMFKRKAVKEAILARCDRPMIDGTQKSENYEYDYEVKD